MYSFTVLCLLGVAVLWGIQSAVDAKICTVRQFDRITRTGLQTYQYSQYHSYRSGRWIRGRRRNVYYTLHTATRTITVTALTTRLTRQCCQGYEVVPGRPTLTCKPICERGCQNGGVCKEPNLCECPKPHVPPDCTNVECNEGHPCFPGLCKRLDPTTLKCVCPPNFKGENCKTNNNGPELDGCSVKIKHDGGGDIIVDCEDNNAAFINLNKITSLEPRMNIKYTGPAYIPKHIDYILDHWFGLDTCSLSYYYNSLSLPERDKPLEIPPKATNHTATTSLDINQPLNHGDRMVLEVKATSGGYRVISSKGREQFSNGISKFFVNITVDHNPPVHCSNATPACNDSHITVNHDSTPNELNTRLNFPGWDDDLSGVASYNFTVLEVETGLPLASGEWDGSSPPPRFHRTAHLSYRISLSVEDAAGNIQKAPEIFVDARLPHTTEEPKDYTAHFTSLFVIVGLLLVGALAATGYFVYRRKLKQRERERDFILKMGREVEFKDGGKKLNRFAKFQLCTVTKGGMDHEAIAKFLDGEPSDEDIQIMIEKKNFWENEKLMHPNVIRYYGHLDSLTGPILAFEYCETGTLNQLLHELRHSELDDPSIERLEHLSTQVALGLKHLHQNGILHTKLTTRHVILSNKSGAKLNNYPHPYCAKIIGFDPSKPRGAKPYRWLAPEASEEGAYYTYESDVYNFATFLLEMFSLGYDPWNEYKTHKEAQAAASHGIKPQRPEYCSTTIYEEVICPATDVKPERRPTMHEISCSLDTSVCEGVYGEIYNEGVTLDVGDIYYQPQAESRERPESGIYY